MYRESAREREAMRESKAKGRAVVVGGSIAGLCSAHALLSAGWDVVVLEKTPAPPTGIPTGAGVGVDPFSQTIINSWLKQSDALLNNHTLPLTIDQNQATDAEKQITRVLTRDESFNFRAAYWSDLHSLLYNALPSHIFLWGHVFQSFDVSHDKKSVKVQSKVIQKGENNIVESVGDLLVAADGCMSSIRQAFLPDLKLRYSGYCAWRGVLDLSSHNEKSDIYAGLWKVYPGLGKCLYFDLGSGTHSVFYELLNKRINWIWYINQPEPQLKGNSVTIKVSSDMMKKMHKEAEKIWVPELVRIIKETKEPFLNVIYDCDPLKQIVWDRVVLVGDSAHPTTPHGLRSTNMSILDAAVLGQCLMKYGVEKLDVGLEEYQSIRLPVTSKQVLHSRKMGRIKQGLVLENGKVFDPKTATPQDCEDLQQKHMPGFNDAPSGLKMIGTSKYYSKL